MKIMSILNEMRQGNQLFEIDFEFADFIVSKEKDSLYHDYLYLASLCLSHFANQQHSLLPLQKMNGSLFSEFLNCELEKDFEMQIPSELNWVESFPVTVGTPGEYKPLIYENGFLYLHKYYMAEQCIVEVIQKSQPVSVDGNRVGDKLEQLFKSVPDKNLAKTNWQKVAAFMALRSNFCVISGGPGTGKTTTVGKILALLLQQSPAMKIHLVAPTGKAADRLGESIQSMKGRLKGLVEQETLEKIPEKASTIHRYLGYQGHSQKFLYGLSKKTDSDLILVDESSMVSLPLFRSMLLALKEECRVILLGDKDQLTAVETGNVLGELTQAEKINVFSKEFCQDYSELTGEKFNYVADSNSILLDRVLKLEHSYRFSEDQGVGKLASLINHCHGQTKIEEFEELFSKYKDISFLSLGRNISVEKDLSCEFFQKYKALLEATSDIKQPEDGLSILKCLNEFRVLCASRVGPFGVESINQMISAQMFKKDDKSLYHGRVVMLLQNNRHLGVYNGDIGVVLNKGGLPHIYFQGEQGKLKEFMPTILPQFETAFAMTVHKSQGSEYDEVCLILPEEGKQHVHKELVYTGVTRAKSQVKIFSRKVDFLEMCQKKSERYSGIAEKLK